jgi:hypothetical protein
MGPEEIPFAPERIQSRKQVFAMREWIRSRKRVLRKDPLPKAPLITQHQAEERGLTQMANIFSLAREAGVTSLDYVRRPKSYFRDESPSPPNFRDDRSPNSSYEVDTLNYVVKDS